MANKFTASYFTVLNKIGQSNLYRTDDLSFNELTFSVTNKAQVGITFKGGDHPSSFEFSMPFLRYEDRDPVKDLQFENIDGWEPVLLLDQKWAVWKFVRKNDLVIAPGQSFSILIKNILCKTIDCGSFNIKTSGVPDYANLDPSLGKGLTVIAPEGSKPSLPLGISYTDLVHPMNTQTDRPRVVSLLKDSQYEYAALPVYLTYDPISPIKNGFRLLLTTDAEIEIFKAGDNVKEASITIMFLFGTYPHQITTVDLGNSIEMNANQVGWKLRRQSDSPIWKWIPDPQIIKEFSTFSFNIRRLVTDLDTVEGVSVMYVQVNNFGKFADHVYRFQVIKKVAEPSIISLSRSKSLITIGENVCLSWDTSLASKLEIAYKSRDNERIVLSTAPKRGEHPIELSQHEPMLLPIPPTATTTTFEATAYGPNNTKVSISVATDVQQRVPEIQSFIATPAIIVKGIKTTVTLSWRVRDASQLKLYIGDEEVDVKNLTSKQLELNGPLQLKLVARSYGDELPNATKTLKICQYEDKFKVKLPFLIDKKGDRPRALVHIEQYLNYVFLHCGQDELYKIFTEGNYAILLETIKTKFNSFDLQLNSQVLAYSNTGSNGRHGIYVKTIRSNDLGSYTAYPDAADLPMPMRFSPDGKRLYVSFRQNDVQCATYFNSEDPNNLRAGSMRRPINGDGSPLIGFNKGNTSVVYIPNDDSHKLLDDKYDNDGSTFTTTPVNGKVIQMIEPSPNSTENNIYLAYENSNLVSLIPTNWLRETIDIGAQPFDMILSADEKTLYVACITENKVIVVNTKNRKVETTYSSIDTPSCLKLSPDGELLFVGNHRARTLTVINVHNGNVAAPIDLGEQAGNPITISVIPFSNHYAVLIGKENYSQRTKWADTIIIKPNTSLNVNMFNFYKPG